MKYTKKDLGSYNLHLIKTDKFKTVTVKIMFQSPIVKEEITIPCTGCQYCVEGCPMKINIPGYFEIYNNSDNERKKKEQYEELVKEGSGRAQDCLKCGKCENACPQHLKIRDLLEKTY